MYLTKTPGIRGRIKQKPEDFVVEEVPLYKLSGEGEHTYMYIEKKNLSTIDMVNEIKKTFRVKDSEIGIAGWKDKRAITRQWVSIPSRLFDENKTSNSIMILKHKNHTNKLRTGKLQGNRFMIIIREVDNNAFNLLKKTLGEIERHGMPNFYGEQRFGIDMNNIQKGRELLLNPNKRIHPRIKRMIISSYASHIFNMYLEERIRQGNMERFIPGDVAKKHATGGLFVVEDVEKENKRAKEFEISPAGPIFGKKMTKAKHDAEKLENHILSKEGIDRNAFDSQTGTRRFLRIPVKDLEAEEEGNKIRLKFFLPAGAYATVLLGEIMKSD